MEATSGTATRARRRAGAGLLGAVLAACGASAAIAAPMPVTGVSPDLRQGVAQAITITGSGFTGSTALAFTDPLISVSGFTVVSDSTITATATVGQLADAGSTDFTISNPGGDIPGTAFVVYPTDLIPVTDDSEPSQSAAMGGVGVALVSGEFITTAVDHATRGKMHGITFSRTYQSKTAEGGGYNGPLGNGWTSRLFERAIHDPGTGNITWYTGSGPGGGRTEVFSWTGLAYTPPPGVYWSASRDAGTGVITLRHRHGHTSTFEGTNGRIVSWADANGNTVSITHNAAGQVTQVDDDRGFRWEFTWYAHGRLHKILDYVWDATTPREVEFAYSAAGDLISRKRPGTARYADATSNRTEDQYTYDINHRLLSHKRPREVNSGGGAWLTNTYDASGRVIQQQVGTASQQLYLRYPSATLARVVDRRGLRTDITLDATGRATAVEQFTRLWEVDTTAPIDHTSATPTAGKVRSTDPDSFLTTTTWNADHEPLVVTYPRGNSVEFTYQPVVADPDVRGNVIETRRKDNALGDEPDLVTTRVFEAEFQKVQSETDPRGFTTTFTYDYQVPGGATAAGNLVRVTSPTVTLGQPAPQVITRSWTYLADGRVATATDGEGFVTTFEHFTAGDPIGFLKKVIVDTATLALTTEFDRDRVGNVKAWWGPRAHAPGVTKDDFKESFEVNELDQTWHVTGRRLRTAAGATDRAEVYRYFDANGLLLQEFEEYVTASGTQPTAPSDPDDPTTFTKATTAMAATWVETSHAYDILNRRTSTTVDAVAGSPVTQLTTSFEFDLNDNPTALQTPLGNRTETSYDERDLVFEVAEGAGSAVEGVYRTDYNANGSDAVYVDALGNVTTIQRDGFERVLRVTDPANHYTTQALDANSNVVLTQHFSAADALLASTTQLWDEVNRNFRTSRLALDRLGAPIGDGADTTDVLRDRNHRVTRVTDDNAVATTVRWDGANRRIGTTDNLLNEVNLTLNEDGAVTETEFVEKNPLTLVDEISHTEAVLDFLNRRVAWRDQRYNAATRDTQVDYSLDGWGRVVTLTDAASVETSSEFDLLSRTTKTTRRPSATGSTWIITRQTWDSDSRLTQNRISKDGSAETSYQTTTYAYDARHRRTSVTLPDGGSETYTLDVQGNRTGCTDLLGTVITATFDPRNLIKERTIARATGVLGATREAYTFDGLGRLTAAHSYETISATEVPRVLQTWGYNTLGHAEQHVQAVHDHTGAALGTYTTGATFDARGLTRTSQYATGQVLNHLYDGLNRLAATQAVPEATLASYVYAGPARLIQRTAGNGAVTTYGYEADGTGLGRSAVLESVTSARSAVDGTAVFNAERRYDVLGNVTAERWGHRGGRGNAFRYDDTYRLKDTYSGVDLSGGALATQADPANTPSAYGMRRNYALDTRTNRTAVTDTDDASPTPNTLRTVSYSPNTDTNVYDTVGGASYTYDAGEQRTADPTSGSALAFDYQGELVAADNTSGVTSAELILIRDTFGRLRAEIRMAGGTTPVRARVFTYLPELGGPPVAADEIDFEPSGGSFATSGESRVFVQGAGAATADSRSGSVNPRSAAAPPAGSTLPASVVLELATDGAATEHRHVHEDQRGTPLGTTDRLGATTREFHSADFGLTSSMAVAFDSADGAIAGVTHSGGFSTLTLSPNAPAPTGLQGHFVRGIGSTAAGTITAVTATTVTVWDPLDTFSGLAGGRLRVGAPADAHAAVRDDPATAVATVDGVDPGPPGSTLLTASTTDLSAVSAGDAVHVTLDFGGGDVQEHWTEVQAVTSVGMPPPPFNNTIQVAELPEYYSPSPPLTITFATYAADTGGTVSLCGHFGATATVSGGVTTLYAERFQPTHVVGFQLQLDGTTPGTFTVTAVTGRTLQVAGDVTSLVTVGQTFVLHAPPGVDATTGSPYTTMLGTDLRYGWGGGCQVAAGGSATGANTSGFTLFAGGAYDPTLGVWITSSAADGNWTNGQAYEGGNPVGQAALGWICGDPGMVAMNHLIPGGMTIGGNLLVAVGADAGVVLAGIINNRLLLKHGRISTAEEQYGVYYHPTRDVDDDPGEVAVQGNPGVGTVDKYGPDPGWAARNPGLIWIGGTFAIIFYGPAAVVKYVVVDLTIYVAAQQLPNVVCGLPGGDAIDPDALSAALSLVGILRGGGSLTVSGVNLLKRAGRAADRGGLTRAGRALAKHGGRPGSSFPRPTGNPAAINQQGQAVLDDILDNVTKTEPNKFGGVDVYGGGNGLGARFDKAGKMMGFLEP